MVRVAVVCLGFMGKAHLGVYTKMPDVRITAFSDYYHVFVEKPLAMTYKSALVIADAAERSGKV